MRKKLLKLSLCLLALTAAIFLLSYFFFHFVTDNGITLTWHAEAGKPFVAELLGDLGVMSLFGSVVSCMAAFILFERE